MGYILGGSEFTKFSWIEYQALMLCLAVVVCTVIFFVEMALKNFQVLPLLFPGMFSVRERRFYFYSFDISDSYLGKKVRGEAKMVIRITLCGVLSYLWQHCVLETTQQVGIDCKSEPKDFPGRVVVSCIHFIPPAATTWLMHLAIGYSLTQLNFKAFELLVWIGGNSLRFRRAIGVLVAISLIIFVALFFGGVMTEFVSSWLAFVCSLTIPIFLYSVYNCAKMLDHLWSEYAVRMQKNIENNLTDAFKDIAEAIQAPTTATTSAATDVSMPRAPKGFVNQMKHKIQVMRGIDKKKTGDREMAGDTSQKSPRRFAPGFSFMPSKGGSGGRSPVGSNTSGDHADKDVPLGAPAVPALAHAVTEP